MRSIIQGNLLFGAALIGLFGGGVALVYNFVLRLMLRTVWGGVYGISFHDFYGANHSSRAALLLALTTTGGFLVGCCLKWLGKPGEIAAVVNNIHMERGRIDIRQTPSMIANSLVSITAGGSAGPEAPLVQIIGSFGSWFGDRLGLHDDEVRTYTFCGMATALGAFFGSPIGGALFALEIPHRRGLEYYEALVPSCVAALIGFLVFRGVLGWDAPIYVVPKIEEFSYHLLWLAVFFGVMGTAAAAIFALIFQTMEKIVYPLHDNVLLLGALGGLLIGGSALFFPESFFWGEFQIPHLLAQTATPWHFFGIAFAKMLTIGFTLHFGYRGGFIFPLFFIGAALGLGISLLFPPIPVAVAVLSLMAAVNVAVTKTPISTTIILTTLSGANLLPILALSSFTSFLVSSRLGVIHSQRSRTMRGAA